MTDPVARHRYIHEVMSGARRGAAPAILRSITRAVEPFYAGAMLLRNRLYEGGAIRTVHLSRPVINVGNLTTGGTGKTPMVRWLASRLRDEGRSVAILSRGYKSDAAGAPGDEQLMLDHMLNGAGGPPVFLRANPDRVAAAHDALEHHPSIDLFILDDGFQHRRVTRDLDIVLLSATDPFGFGHVLPRGMLREPIGGISRAGAVVITHADRVDEFALRAIEGRVRMHHPQVPIYRAVHAPVGLRTSGTNAAAPPDRSLDDLRQQRFYAFCGIGDPASFHRQLEGLGRSYVGRRWFPDHHCYVRADLDALRAEAMAAGVDVLVTTEKDWVKVAALAGTMAGSPQIWRWDVAIRFHEEGERALLEQVRRSVAGRSAG